MKTSISKYFYVVHYLMHIVFFACRQLNGFLGLKNGSLAKRLHQIIRKTIVNIC